MPESKPYFRKPQAALLLLAALAAAHLAQPVSANAATRLAGNVPAAAIVKAVKLGSTSAAKPIRLAITLPLRDQAGLKRLTDQLYDRSSPLYGKYLKPKEFAARFGPTQADYDAVKAFATSHGLTVVGEYSSRALLDVEGPATAVQSAFGVKLNDYKGSDGNTFYAPDSEPVIPDALAGKIIEVVGLSNAFHKHPMIGRFRGASDEVTPAASHGVTANNYGSGPNGGYTPSDVRTAYNLNPSDGVTETGVNQVMALYEMGTQYTPSDITTYETYYALSSPTLTETFVDGTPQYSTDVYGEETLDIDMFLDLASSASKIELYEGVDTSFTTAMDLYAKIASDDSASVVSCSWGAGETDGADLQSENNSLMQMASQGQSSFDASGDDGAYADGYDQGLDVQDPASQPYSCAVGGTTMATTSPGGPWASETTWEGTTDGTDENGGGSGGGVSTVWALPSYQEGLSSFGSPASATYRNVPDVVLNADYNHAAYSYYRNGTWRTNGGTSAASPLWAAMTALANQRRDAYGLPKVGFINPSLYSIAEGANGAGAYHDITTQNNLYYNATAGYDNATGWGSFIGGNMLTALNIVVPYAYPTIQAAIDAAADGATITIAPGTYTGSGNINLTTDGKALTLVAANGPGTVVIDCQGNGNGFQIGDGESSSTVIEGITVKNGSSSDAFGGAAEISYSSPTFISCSFVSNTATYGGAVYIYESNPTFEDCYFDNNSASDYGGALYDIYESNATFTNCVFANNSAGDDGWTMYDYASDPSFINCSVYDGATSESIFNLDGTEELTNTILFGATGFEISGADADATNCDIEQSPSIIASGSGNIEADPMFLSPSTDNLEVPNGSPVAQAGTPNGAPADDILGNPRPNPPSIGAYEASVVPPVLTSIYRNVFLSREPATGVTLTGSGFAATSVVYADGAPISSTYVSGSTIKATVPAADIASAGSVTIYVVTPGPNGGQSATLTLPVLYTRLEITAGVPFLNSSNQIVVPITLKNAGRVAATNVTVQSAVLGNQATPGPLPATIAKIAPGHPATFSLTFSQAHEPSGQKRQIKVSGVFNGGTFSDSTTVTLP